MFKAWWVTQLDRKQLVDQLTLVQSCDTTKVYRLNQVGEATASIFVDQSVFTLTDPREQLQLSYSESLEPPYNRWTLKKVPLHVAQRFPLGTYVDVGNNMIRVFEEVSEFTRRY